MISERRGAFGAPSRIAHVISTPQGVGGAEKVMLSLLRGGVERGWDQIVLNPFEAAVGPSILGLHVADIDGVDYRARSTTRFREVPGARSWLRSEIAGFSPAIVHIHLFHALVLTASLRLGQAIRILSHHHGAQLRIAGRRIQARLDERAGKRLDYVVACSRWVYEFLIDGYGYAPERVIQISNGWEGQPLEPSFSSDERCVFVCVAHFRPEKDHRTLLKAFHEVRSHNPAVQLLLVGEGPMRSDIEGMIHGAGLRECVRLLGPTEDVWPILSGADVFVLPSRNETFGMAVLEAMAAALPVIATSVGGVPEIVESGRTGLLVPSGDVEAMASAMSELARVPERGREMGRAGRRRAETMKMQQTVDRYFDLYERVLG